MSSISSDLSYGLQLDPKTADALSHFARRRRVLLGVRAAAAGIVCFIAIMLLLALCDYLWLLSDGVRWALSLCGYALTFAAMWWFGLRHFGNDDPRQVARQLESAAPRLREDLLSAVELADPQSANGSDWFRNRLQRNVASRAALLDISRLLPVGLIQRWLATGALVALGCFVLLMLPQMQFGRRIARAMLPGIAIQRASLTEVTILHPSPPSAYVAEGDAVGVVVRVGGADVRDVMMQWRSVDGIEGESVMSPRVAPESSPGDGTLRHEDVYAANLSVGTTPIEYRIIAGDAITLWHELTPLPRPRVESFHKRYVFPDYAELADRVEEAEHGDLKAFVGTLAEVTVRFDEPVTDATLRFGNRGVTFNLDAVDGSDREFVVTIPIKTPAHYQVDAKSARSGLNNPFSPQYSITPIIDTPPVVRWSQSLPRTLIVSPLDVVSLAATAIDDLPIERVVQEFQINGEPVVRRDVSVAQAGRELNLGWDWDLLRRIDGEEPTIKLAGGDIIRTRVVGIDRRSHRGESGFIELLIAEEGFDSNRHDRLEELSGVLSELADWALRANQLMQPMKEVAEKGQRQEFSDAKKSAEELHGQRQAITGRLQRAVENSTLLPEASTLELLGRALTDFHQKLGDWFAQTESVLGEDHEAWAKTREKALRDLSGESRRRAQEATRIEQYARAVLGEELTVGIVADAMSLQRSLRPLLDEETKLPADRFPRYVAVAIGRLQAIDELIDQNNTVLPESTRRHLENWHRWSDSWAARLKASIEKPPKEDAHRALIAQFDAELQNQFNHGMVDGRLASTVTNLLREIRVQLGSTSDRVRLMAAGGATAGKAREQAEKVENSDDVARLNRDATFADMKFQRGKEQVVSRLADEEALHRSRPNVDLQYAADMKLMHRAIENVTAEGYVPYREEPAATVHQNLAKAFQIIESKHEADMWLGELLALMLAERRLDETALAKIKHATWIERFSTGLDWPVRALRNTGIDRQLVDVVDRTRYSGDFNQAKQRITARRWSGEAMLTAEVQIDALQRELTTALAALEPSVVEARHTIEKYVLTLPEQARQAAQKAREAKERTQSRPDSQQDTAEELAQQQQEAEEATRETLESLVDLANTSDVADAEQRELARDADAAAAQIQAAVDQAQEAMEKATEAADENERSESLNETAQALEDLAESLEQTADHFERAENGEDLAESREQLRQAEEALQFQNEMQEQYDRTEAMANAAESSPEELMERLERELQQNEPMQQELSEIAERAAEAAQRTLQQAAKDEAALNQSLERSDTTFQERKRRASRELANLARRVATVDDALLGAAQRAAASAKAPETRPKLDQARKDLREAVQQSSQMGGENALLSKMQDTAGQMARAIQAAKEAIEEAGEQADQVKDESIHKDEPTKKRAKDQLDRYAKDARAKQLRATTTEKQQWDAAKRDAGRRVQQAQRQKRDAENRKRQMEQRIKKEKNSADALKQQLAQLQQNVDDAERNEQSAKETQDFADQKGKEVDQRAKQLKSKKIDPLDKPNPAAQLATQMTQQASDELSEIERNLNTLSQQTNFGDQLRAPQPQAQQLANQQQRIEQDVNDAAEQLRRAARHEQRLGQEDLAEQLDAAANAVSENAASAAAEAEELLQQAAGNAEQTPQANRQVAQATQKISEAAQRLAEMLSAATPESEAVASEPGQPSPSQERGQQLAQTLDELDRAMAEPQQGEQSPQQGEAAQDGQPQSGQAGEPSDQPSQQTAGEASPTLSGALDAQAQQAARQRQQQINPSPQGQPQSGPQSDQTASGNKPATESGSGEMPGGGFVETTGVDRLGSQWGQLRERRTEDATESRSATVAPQYRREIEAYFRAIARRAAEKAE